MEQRRTKDELAREHLPLVERIVSSEMRRFGRNIDRDDVYSHAMEGLAMAIERFDPQRNILFATFASPRIRGAIFDGLSQSF